MFEPRVFPLMMYAEWYKEDVSPNLTKKQKIKLLKKISDTSLRRDITSPNVKFSKKDYPELAPFMHTEDLSGLQLYAVMTELFHEVHLKSKIPKPYPSMPRKKLKKVV